MSTADLKNFGAAVSDAPKPPDPAEMARTLRAQLAAVAGGLAPDAYVNAWWDWYLNLAEDPPKQQQIMQDAVERAVDTWNFALQAVAGTAPSASHDARFSGDAWAQWPFNVYAHGYRKYVDWWHQALSNVPGVSPENERTLDFLARNALETLSPANF